MCFCTNLQNTPGIFDNIYCLLYSRMSEEIYEMTFLDQLFGLQHCKCGQCVFESVWVDTLSATGHEILCDASPMCQRCRDSTVFFSRSPRQGGKEYMMRAHFGLPSVESEELDAKRPVTVNFEIPYFTVSGIQVGQSKRFAFDIRLISPKLPRTISAFITSRDVAVFHVSGNRLLHGVMKTQWSWTRTKTHFFWFWKWLKWCNWHSVLKWCGDNSDDCDDELPSRGR